MTTLPDFTPMRVRLVGHRDLGTINARWRGCLLETDGGTIYGPSAVFSAEPSAETQDPAPAQLLSKWVCIGQNVWYLYPVHGTRRIAWCDAIGWAVSLPDVGVHAGPETGLHGRENAVDYLLERGWKWADPSARKGHDTRGLSVLSGRTVTMIDGAEKRVSTSYGEDVLFDDGTWLSTRDAGLRIDRVHPRFDDDDIPF